MVAAAEASTEVQKSEVKKATARGCAGIVYFSKALSDRGYSPTCAGFTKGLRQEETITAMEAHNVPEGGLGDFKYACAGYSTYRVKDTSASDDSLNKEETELPYCEGLEVLIATNNAHTDLPVDHHIHNRTVGDDGVTSARGPLPTWASQEHKDRRRTQGSDLDQFSDRFIRMSGLIVKRMGTNLQTWGNSLRRLGDFWDDGSGK